MGTQSMIPCTLNKQLKFNRSPIINWTIFSSAQMIPAWIRFADLCLLIIKLYLCKIHLEQAVLLTEKQTIYYVWTAGFNRHTNVS
jgi:hypothetical protein